MENFQKNFKIFKNSGHHAGNLPVISGIPKSMKFNSTYLIRVHRACGRLPRAKYLTPEKSSFQSGSIKFGCPPDFTCFVKK